MQVSTAAAYDARWAPPTRSQYDHHPPEYSTPSSSLPSSPYKSPSPTRPLLAAAQHQGSPLAPAPPLHFRDRSSPTRNARHPFAETGFTYNGSHPQYEHMSGQGGRWAPVGDNHEFNDIPAPPSQGRSHMAQDYHGDRGYQAYQPHQTQHDQQDHYGGHGYHDGHDYHRDQGYDMDDRHHDTAYGGAGAGYAQGHDYGYDQGSLSARDNHFNRNSMYGAGPYADVSPSPARLSRPEFDDIDPHSIADDDDHGYQGQTTGRGKLSKIPAAGGAALGGAGAYSSVGQGGSSQGLTPGTGDAAEKSAWREAEESDRKKRKRKLWIIVAIVALVVIAGAVAGGILGTRNLGKGSSNGASSGSNGGNSDSLLNKDSKEIKALMNNKDLHKVFPVMDYTAYKTQFPDCLLDPPSQNNVTMDMAVLSQLTSAVRVYGTDCNQTEMALTAIDRLGLNDTMKVWLGVWIDTNTTTNDRQMAQMYDILRKYPQDHFHGVIVANEALFREDITETDLVELLKDTKANLTSMGINLSVSTSDLGSAWTPTLAEASDHVMGNVHPFFAGVTAEKASGWTWVFWQGNNVYIAPEPANAPAGSIPRNIISEVGWPSAGGNKCTTPNGVGIDCAGPTDGSVAGITEMNQFMDSWVCQANANNTMYFWFEAFDEPWKVKYNTDKEQWEDKWGLMGIDRKLKDGVKIPDCGGKTV